MEALVQPAIEQPLVQANALRSLLGTDLVGSIQVGREYPGRCTITDEHLAAHFAGQIAIAIRVGNGRGRSRHLVIDIDARAPQRIPHVLHELRRRGYGDATIVTDGSGPDRGKVIVFFRSEQQSGALRQLATDVLVEPRTFVAWGVEAPGEVSVYPQRGEGGLARIGGRNIGRNGPMERLWNAWAEPIGLHAVVPSKTRLRAVQDPRKPIRTSPRQAWVDRLMRDGLTWAAVGGTRGLNALVNRLAHETARTHGTAQYGQAEFARVLDTIASASPDLHRPSPKNRDRRHPLAWGRRSGSAWRNVCAQHGIGYTTYSGPPLERSVTYRDCGDPPARLFLINSKSGAHGDAAGLAASSTPPPRAARNTPHAVTETAALLVTLVARRGLNPLAFELSYRELAEFLGISHKVARDRVLRTEKYGLIVRLHPGLQGSGGRYTGRPGGGAKTLYALVPVGDNADSVRCRAEQHHALARRRAFAEREQERRAALRAEREAQKPASPSGSAGDAPSMSLSENEARDLLAYALVKLSAPPSSVPRNVVLSPQTVHGPPGPSDFRVPPAPPVRSLGSKTSL